MRGTAGTRTTAALTPLALALIASTALAQTALPPPPPPPVGTLPPLPAAPEPDPAPAPARAPAPESAPAPARAPAPPPHYAAAPPPPPYRHFRRRREVVEPDEPDPHRPVSLTLNPVALALGRLSGNVEVLLAPHHALVLSPNVLVVDVDRGDSSNLASAALGYASPTSASVGAELGYHYWLRWGHTQTGPFFGPSLLVGRTSAPTAGASDPVTYWGAALDAGAQHVFPGGFTFGAGLGLGFTHVTGASAIFPRFLLQMGWSF